jgi:isopenicillin N synthase-like dioxygenase
MSVPTLDFQEYAGSGRAAFVRALGEGLERFGFVSVTGHGIPAALLDRAYRVAESVFRLPERQKLACEHPASGRQRGYTPYGQEKAKGFTAADLKEFWQVGRELPEAHPLRAGGQMAPNLFPAALPEAREVFLALYEALERFAQGLLEAVGEHLGLPRDFFRELTRDGDSILRIIHYPDLPGGAPQGAVRAAPHEDINLMTVLPASTRPGLELLTRDGRWLAVQPPAGAMICDTGDMMAHLTAGRLPATTHRVVNPGQSDGARYSMPFFLHPRADAMLRPLGAGEPILARDLLNRRLREIGVLAAD